MMESYPLRWPEGWKRAKSRKTARYTTTFGETRNALVKSIRLLGSVEIVISSNIPTRRDGLPYSSYAEPTDPGVAVYFTMKGKQRVIACDRWKRAKDNLRAVYLAAEALRQLERTGASEILDRAFLGFAELSSGPRQETCWETLGILVTNDQSVISTAYRALAKLAHPDVGGTTEGMTTLNAAYEQAIKYAKGES
jgi:hypothetical protein